MNSPHLSGPIVVLCDSLSFYGPRGGLPANDARIWPNLVANQYGVESKIFGRVGWTCRDAYWALIGDPNIWAQMPHASMLIIATGGMDTLPSPLPTAAREMMRYLRPEKLRRVVRSGYTALQPRLSHLGWPQALPPHLIVYYLEKMRATVTALRPELPIVFLTPVAHNAPSYSGIHIGYERSMPALRHWIDEHHIPTIEVRQVIQKYLALLGDISAYSASDVSDDLPMNIDGIHWGFGVHREVAAHAINTIDSLSSLNVSNG